MTRPVLTAQAGAAQAGKRLDKALAELFPDYSRAFLKRHIDERRVLVGGRSLRPADRVAAGDEIRVAPLEIESHDDIAPEPLALDIVYEDDALLVLNKAPGMVMYPAAGHAGGSVANALLHHDAALAALPRGGIVHRLDKDTGGLVLVAKTLAARKALVEDMQARRIRREYLCLVCGRLIAGGIVDAPLGRDPRHRQRMAVVAGGRDAVTHYRIARRLPAHTLLAVRLETGRTHQIRVHMAHLGHRVFGDPVYGGRRGRPSPDSPAAVRSFRRQALHACALEFAHPTSGRAVKLRVDLPDDFQALLQALGGAEAGRAPPAMG